MRKIAYIDDLESWKEEFEFSIDIDIRFSEVDMFGHMNNVASFAYFEEARIKYMMHIGIFTDLAGDEVPVVGDLQCDYHQQIFFGEQLKLFVKVNSVGNSSMDIHYMGLKPNGEIGLTGRGVIINMSKTTGRSVPLTEEIKSNILVGVEK